MRTAAPMFFGMALCVLAARAQDYPTPSFDCANITTEQELHICRTPKLAELDGKHGHLAELAVRTAKNREQMVKDVDLWLLNVRNACQNDKCLEDAYAARIAELERIVSSQPPLKSLPGWVAQAPLPAPVAPSPSNPLPPPVQAMPPAPEKVAPTPEVPPNDTSDDDEEEDETPWLTYAAIAGFVLFAAVVWLVISRAGRSAKG